MFPKKVYQTRRQILAKDLESGIILIPGNSEAPANYRDNCYKFRQDSTFLYFFGISDPDNISPIRRAPACPYAAKGCGGCAFPHITPEGQATSQRLQFMQYFKFSSKKYLSFRRSLSPSGPACFGPG